MSAYLVAAVVGAGVALLALVLLMWRAAASARRFRSLSSAYGRHLAAQSALLQRRRAALLAELVRRRRRTPRDTPRTMR